MAWQLIGENGTVQQVGGGMFRAAHTHPKPIEYVSGHYRTVAKATLLASQAANSRLFEVRNAGTNLLIPTRLDVTVFAFGSIAFPYILDLSVYKYTGFSAVDTAATVTPAAVVARSTMASSVNAQIRAVTVTGNAAGMTGGTLGAKSGSPIGSVLAFMASVNSSAVEKELTANVPRGEHPMTFGLDEGFVIENVTVGSATANPIGVVIHFAWCEAQAY